MRLAVIPLVVYLAACGGSRAPQAGRRADARAACTGDDVVQVTNNVRGPLDIVASYGGSAAVIMIGTVGPGITNLRLNGTPIEGKAAAFDARVNGQSVARATTVRFQRRCDPPKE
jgi:hypothetical protein